MKGRRREPIGGPLGLIGEVLYRTGAGFRNALYDAGVRRSRHLPARVISVGNLTAGGTGKTPVVADLVPRFEKAGWNPVILSRGHGRDDPARLEAVPVSDEGALPEEAHLRYGDEPCLLRSLLPHTPILLSADRVRAGREAIERFGADLLLLDDGFQHRRLARNDDLVVLRGEAPFGNGRLLPRGILREPPTAIRRASFVLINRTRGERKSLDETLDRFGAPTDRIRFAYRPDRLLDPVGDGIPIRSLRDRPALAVSGIGEPASFEETLVQAGANLAGRLRFADHHRFSTEDCAKIAEEAGRLGALPVTTEKDRIRLDRESAEAAGVHGLTVKIVWADGADALHRLTTPPRKKEL